MKKILALFVLISSPSYAATCYSSYDCNQLRQEQIREANERQMEEVRQRNEHIEQDRKMREAIEQDRYDNSRYYGKY